ncbi:MAG: hypothetical protein Q8N96_08640 [Methylovulum sp.]|nr:hypothetical protein [Methylovulum sp.]
MATLKNQILHYAAFTHPGKCYRQNQDALLLAGDMRQKAGFWQGSVMLDKRLRFAIADGAGGLPCAAKASRILLQELAMLDQVQPQLLPRQRLIPLHNRLLKASKSQRALQNGGATLITAEIEADGQISLWHVGDSRGYHYSLNSLRRLTDDHTLAFCLGRTGNHSHAHQQALANTQLGQALDNLFIYSQAAEEPFIGLRYLKLLPDDVLLNDKYMKFWTESRAIRCFGHFENSELDVILKEIQEVAQKLNAYYGS